jgi:uncharacterized protein (DUF488 family)
MDEIYTIGHSSYTQEQFLELLLQYQINCIVDVRSIPYSKYASQFNKEEIKRFLKNRSIYYVFMGKELGARREDRNLYTNEGYLDFEKTSKTLSFLNGIERIETGIEKGYRIAIMCKEKDPIDCHRNILVARKLYIQGYKVLNILESGLLESQEDLEIRLLNIYFPERDQLSISDIYSNRVYDSKFLINEAYKLRNKEIGYCIDKEQTQNEIIHNRVY